MRRIVGVTVLALLAAFAIAGCSDSTSTVAEPKWPRRVETCQDSLIYYLEGELNVGTVSQEGAIQSHCRGYFLEEPPDGSPEWDTCVAAVTSYLEGPMETPARESQARIENFCYERYLSTRPEPYTGP